MTAMASTAYDQRRVLSVGLTGGIATGKSHVLRRFAELGVATIDADLVARELVEPGQPALRQIVETFGPQVLTSEGRLDRHRLGKIVFSHAPSRKALNNILHPPILRTIRTRVQQVSATLKPEERKVLVVDAALLIETGSYRDYDLITVVYCPPDEQVRRLMARNSLLEEDARIRLSSQIPDARKLAYADYVISTVEVPERTREQVDQLFQEWSFHLDRFDWRTLLKRTRYRQE
jgi:dephospho-CoA kinase